MLLSNTGKQPARDRVLEAYEEARDDVYYYVLTLGVSAAQAQDVTQEVFLKLHVQLQSGEEIRNTRAWVFRVAHNEALKLRSKERTHTPIDEVFEPVAKSKNPEKQMIEDESRRRISEALADLSPQQRQVLLLRASGLRYREIADTIGVGTSTVNEFLRRAITRLRKAIHA